MDVDDWVREACLLVNRKWHPPSPPLEIFRKFIHFGADRLPLKCICVRVCIVFALTTQKCICVRVYIVFALTTQNVFVSEFVLYLQWRRFGFFVTQLTPDWTLCSSFNICHPTSLSILPQQRSWKFCLLILWTVMKGWCGVLGLMDVKFLCYIQLLWKRCKEIKNLRKFGLENCV